MKWHRLITAMIVGVVLLGSAMVLPATAQLRGEVPGSFLIFPEFNISPGPFPGGPGPAVTQLRICDVQIPTADNPNETVFVHLNYICPGSTTMSTSFCAESDSHKTTTHHGCIILDVATDGPLCNKGYIIAFAENGAGLPISSNTLIGSYRISGTDGDDAEATNAIAVQSKQNPDTILGHIDAATSELVLTFGLLGTDDYVALPFILFSDFQLVNTTATPPKRTELIVLTPSIKSGAVNPLVTVAINFWHPETEEGHSVSKQFTCWNEFELESLSPLLTVQGIGLPLAEVASMQVRASAAPFPAILGVIRETGPGPTLRRMYHVGLRSSLYFPDPATLPPGP